MKKIFSLMTLFIFLLVALFPGASFAESTDAIYYVRQGASGNNDGSDWNNAYNTLPDTLESGATYYIADGTYPGYTFDDAVSEVTTIKKATASDHGTDIGWQADYGDGQALFNGMIEFKTSNWVFDGQTGGGAGSWDDGYGFKIYEDGGADGSKPIIYVGSDVTEVNNITIRHVDMEGKGSAAASNDGISIYNSSNITLSYAWIHETGRCPVFIIGARDAIFEHIYVSSYYGDSAGMSAWQGNIGDITWRYSLFTAIKATGGLMWGPSNANAHLYVYGNVFYKPAGVVWDRANGLIGGWTHAHTPCRNVWVYNNTFINVDQPCLSIMPTVYSGNVAYNNIFYNCESPNFKIFEDHDSNYFINSGGKHGEPHGVSAVSGDPFVDYEGLDFRLNAPASENSYFDDTVLNIIPMLGVDPLGVIRGEDGEWDRGAYEYVSEEPTENYYYVRQGASGNNDGSDWNNAYNTLPDTLESGATYYIADGTYPGYTFDDAVSEVTTIKKATASDHGTDIGWQADYGDGQALFNGMIEFKTSNWVFDGQTGGGIRSDGVANWDAGYGFKIYENGGEDGLKSIIKVNGLEGEVKNIRICHVDMEGKGSPTTAGGYYSNDGIAIYNASDIILSHAWIHESARCPVYISGARDTIFEYIYVSSFYGSSEAHSEVMSAYHGDIGDITWRYSLITAIKSTGGLMWGPSNEDAHLYVYGNVFYKPAGVVWDRANGLIGGWTHSFTPCRNVWVYNNTFINVDQECLSTFPTIYSGNVAYNNLFYNCESPNFKIFEEHDSNYFINSGGKHGEPHGVSAGSGDPFENYEELDFRLKIPTSQNSYFDRSLLTDNPLLGVDPLGVPRGEDEGGWDRGAYEYNGPLLPPDQSTIKELDIVDVQAKHEPLAPQYTAAKTLDDDLSDASRWSGSVDWAQITYDLGEVKFVSAVDIAFADSDYLFDIVVSTDGENFTKVQSKRNSGGSTAVQRYDVNSNARYVRIIGYYNETVEWAKFTAIDYVGILDADGNGIPIIEVTANRSLSDATTPENTLIDDGRNWVGYSDWTYITYDLGEVREIESVDICWAVSTEQAYTFEIAISNDGENFTSVVKRQTSEKIQGMQNISLGMTARYVRIVGLYNDTVDWTNWINISEVKIYGPSDEEEVDKTELNAAIALAESLTSTDYTEASWSLLQAALTAAREVAADEDATQEDVDTALENLQTAINGLEAAYSLVIGNETAGGAGCVRTITIDGNTENLAGKYMVVQFTEGEGSAAKVSVVMISASDETVTVSYQTAGTKVEVWLASGMPDLVGEDLGVTVYAYASTNQ